MAALSVTALAVAVVGAVVRPWSLPAWLLPAGGVVADLAGGAISWHSAHQALSPLAAPLGFLLAAVPLAVLLDRLGFFSALAGRLIAAGGAAGSLWVLGALVTTVFNLDAGVVLLTPLYIGIARRQGTDPFALAAQPVLLACLASSALPVSNLTNLIAQAETGARTADFLSHLALPSLAACAVGWWCYRWTFPVSPAVGVSDEREKRGGWSERKAGWARGGGWSGLWDGRPGRRDRRPGRGDGRPGGREGADRRALTVGGAVVVVVLIGFVFGRDVGIEPWVVALSADAVLVVLLRQLPIWQIPLGTAVVAGCLAVLAAALVAHVSLHGLIGGTSTASVARTAGVTAAGANVVNNLPALLVALHLLGPHPGPALWPVLIGVNMGPVVLVTGSLASLLWLDTLHRLGVAAHARTFTRIGVRIGLPAALAGFAVQLALHAAGVR